MPEMVLGHGPLPARHPHQARLAMDPKQLPHFFGGSLHQRVVVERRRGRIEGATEKHPHEHMPCGGAVGKL